eukprot:CAMPEP_0184478458 /NCGR_PEP_ID=MMETSP0113_2-20130426/485_1 /TAXON_ID=91329 /ORGANISM="Norrisiella sphaerica, Strain BC52" /LENGTH=71 /DNA_ID=CAMNT_0026856261 /DNA_START=88 /DNA_END=303 /DNA_ORIENTATION=-
MITSALSSMYNTAHLGGARTCAVQSAWSVHLVARRPSREAKKPQMASKHESGGKEGGGREGKRLKKGCGEI